MVAATEVWELALRTSWQQAPVWVDGDISPDNLLVKAVELSAVIDFCQLAVGDPSCDLAITWAFFKGKSRGVFKSNLPLDTDTWIHGRAWNLWKALIIAAGFTNPNCTGAAEPRRIIDEILVEHREHF